MRRFLVFVGCLLALCGSVCAQSQNASLSGRVVDQSGAGIVGADVTATNIETNVASDTKTNDAGNYVFATLSPGTYRLTVKAQGFRQNVLERIVVHVQDRLTENISLQVGAMDQIVTVTAEAQPLNTESAAVGTVVERQFVSNIPLNGRSFQGLITLTPGVTTVATNTNNAGQFVVNGQRADTNYFTVDGVSANTSTPIAGNTLINGTGASAATSASGGFNNMVSVDALQEFRISTSSFAPEFGRSPGGQVSLVSRAGTNAFHGDIFDYLRNTVLDANDWFLKAKTNAAGVSTPSPRGVVQQNDFGGVLGGRIIKDKLFFFGSYEGLRLNAPSPAVKTVPTQDLRTKAAAAVANGVTGYMAQFWNAYPLPDGNPTTLCTTAATCIANYTASFPSHTELDATSARVDYVINPRMNLFGRYSHTPSSLLSADTVKTNATAFLSDTYTAGLTSTFTNTLTNDVRFNFTHATYVNAVNPINFTGSFSTIFPTGFAQPEQDFDKSSYAFQFSFTGVDTLNLSPNARNHGNDQINITDSVSWLRGSHQLKFGGDFRQLTPAANQANHNNNITFTGTTCPAGSGFTGLPGFICGIANLANIQHLVPLHFRIRQYSFFGQDTWRISQRLTATYGVRWDINPAPDYLTYPAWAVDPNGFDKTNLLTMKILGLGPTAYETRFGNVAPRVGLAYQLSKSADWGSVIRAGYGVFYDSGANSAATLQGPYSARCNNQGACTLPPYTGPTLATVPMPLSVANERFVKVPVFPSSFTFPIALQTDQLIDPHFRLPYVHEMNLTWEQQIKARQTLSVGYVGALGKHLIAPVLYPPNKVNPNYLGNGTIGDTVNVFENAANSWYHSLQTKFQRQFTNGLGALASYTWSHSIDTQSTGNGVNQNGALLQAVPTAANLATIGLATGLLKASSDFDVRNAFAFSLVYETPKRGNAWERAVVGHWTISPIYHYQSAAPVDVILNATSTLASATNLIQRPNLIPGVPLYVTGDACATQYATAVITGGASGPSGFSCPGGRAFNNTVVTSAMASTLAAAGCVTTANAQGIITSAKGAFCTPTPVGTQAVSGNVGRNILRGFPLQELDFSLSRDFPLNERFRLKFQADMFNVFNHPNFGAEAANVSLATFGRSTAMANSALSPNSASGAGFNPIFSTGGPRNYQFALKLFF